MRILSLVAFVALTSLAISGAVTEHGRLQAKDGKLVGAKGETVNLKGMSMFWSQWSGSFWTADVIDWLVQDWKITLVRCAMGVPDQQQGYAADRNQKNLLTTVVDAAIKNDIYAIIDWHLEGENNWDGLAREFFGEMAQKYGSKPHVMYEGWNEPTGQDWNGRLKPYHESILGVIRPHTQNLYIAGNRSWSSNPQEACNNRLNDVNSAYTLHFYASTHKGDVRARGQDAAGRGCTVAITEWGVCDASGNGAIDFGSAGEWMGWAHTSGVLTANWSLFDKAESCSAVQAGAGPAGLKSGALSESGNWVRADIRGEAPKPGPSPSGGGCCTWEGGPCRSFRDWCDKAPGNCSTCGGNFKPNSGPAPAPGGSCCSWGGPCRSFRDWCDKSAANCSVCGGHLQPGMFEN